MEENRTNEQEVQEMVNEGVVDEGSKDLALVCLGAVGVGIAIWEGGKWVIRKVKSKLPFKKKDKDEPVEKSSDEKEKPEEK